MTENTIVKEINQSLTEMYQKVVTIANHNNIKKGFIKCPDCGEEILMIPTLKTMNQAIENHVKLHKETLKNNPLLEHQTAMHIRLDLAQQVLQLAGSPELF